MKCHNEIVKGITGFIQHWEEERNANVTGLYRHRYAHCVNYWTRVRDALLEPEMEACDTLFMGFWPQTQQSFEMRIHFLGDVNVQAEFAGDEHYIGPRSSRLVQPYHVGRDCHKGHYILVRPA
jgi:hypothetical protein